MVHLDEVKKKAFEFSTHFLPAEFDKDCHIKC